MAKRTKHCGDTLKDLGKKEEKKQIKVSMEGLKRFTFPKDGVSVVAKDLPEATRKLKVITGFKNKAI